MNNSKKDNPFDYLFRVLEKLPKTTEKIVVTNNIMQNEVIPLHTFLFFKEYDNN